MRACAPGGFWTACRSLCQFMECSTCSRATAGSAKTRLMGKWRLRSIPVRSWKSNDVNNNNIESTVQSEFIILNTVTVIICSASPSLTVINFEVTVVTGDVRAGGTNANVFCQIYGDEGKTEVIALKSRSNNFERGTTEIFRVCMKPVSCYVNVCRRFKFLLLTAVSHLQTRLRLRMSVRSTRYASTTTGRASVTAGSWRRWTSRG